MTSIRAVKIVFYFYIYATAVRYLIMSYATNRAIETLFSKGILDRLGIQLIAYYVELGSQESFCGDDLALFKLVVFTMPVYHDLGSTFFQEIG